MTAPVRPHVLFVGAFPPPTRQVFGGQVSACRALLASSFSDRCELDLLDTTQISNPPPGFSWRVVLAARRFVVFVWKLERHRPDVVLLFLAVGASVVEKGTMAWYARMRGVPAVLFPRGGGLLESAERSSLYGQFLRVAFGGGRMVFCQSPRWQAFCTNVLRLSLERSPVILNWSASAELIAVGRARLVRRGGPLRVLFVGWIELTKGVRDLLEALQLLAINRHYVVDIVGDGSFKAEAQQLAGDWGLSDRVRFAGWLSGEALINAYAQADVFVLPSWEEGLPNAMIEAFATKLAVVVSDVGAVADLAHDGINALLVPARDVGSLRDALRRILEDDDLRTRLASAGFDMAESQCDVDAAVPKLVRGLEMAMGRRQIQAVEAGS